MTKQKRPLAELLPIAKKLCDELRPFCERIEIAGSLRRRVVQVGDIELVAIPRFEDVVVDRDLFGVEKTERVNLLWKHLASNPVIEWKKRGQKYRQFVLAGIQVDLFTAEPGNWGWIYVIRTGSADFSHRMAKRLNTKGYTSRDGWIETQAGPGERQQTPEEEDVFKLVGFPVVIPEMRR